jgi:ABC-type glycerol-3-phosphate transport system substrate-binding protein
MLIRSPHRLLLVGASLLVTASLVFSKQEIDLWFVPMSQEGPQTPGLLAWAKEHFSKDLPCVTVPGNYGPPIYQDAQQKFIVQGRRGKPDVIEGVLEGMIAYQKASLIAPIDDLFNQWPEKDKFIPSTIKALTINGKLYGVPYNTNVRVLLYRRDMPIRLARNCIIPCSNARRITNCRNRLQDPALPKSVSGSFRRARAW